jgi:hypothetical protein
VEAGSLRVPVADVSLAEEVAGRGGEGVGFGGGDRGGAVEDHDVITQTVEEEGGGEADAGGATGDENCFVGVGSKFGLGDGVCLRAGHAGSCEGAGRKE